MAQKERIVVQVAEVERHNDKDNGWGSYTIWDDQGEMKISVPADRNDQMKDEGIEIQPDDELHLTSGPKDNWVLTALPNEEPERGGSRGGGGSSRRGRSSSGDDSRGSSSRSSRGSSSRGSSRGSSSRGSSRNSGGGSDRSKSKGNSDVNNQIKMQEYMKIAAKCLACAEGADLDIAAENVGFVIEQAHRIDGELNG